jgi:hypothetical protein
MVKDTVKWRIGRDRYSYPSVMHSNNKGEETKETQFLAEVMRLGLQEPRGYSLMVLGVLGGNGEQTQFSPK